MFDNDMCLAEKKTLARPNLAILSYLLMMRA
jgi:hypothetical protein